MDNRKELQWQAKGKPEQAGTFFRNRRLGGNDLCGEIENGRIGAAYEAGKGHSRWLIWFDELAELYEVFKLYTYGIGTVFEIHKSQFGKEPTRDELWDYVNFLR